MEFHFPRRGQVLDHQWLARTVGIAKASGMWEAPQVPNGPQAEACGSDRVAGNTQSGGLTRYKQSRGL